MGGVRAARFHAWTSRIHAPTRVLIEDDRTSCFQPGSALPRHRQNHAARRPPSLQIGMSLSYVTELVFSTDRIDQAGLQCSH